MRHFLKSKAVKVFGGLACVAAVVLGLFVSDGFWNSLNPVFHRDVLYQCAGDYKLDPLLVAAVISVESSFNPVATSPKQAMGLMQIMPATAYELAAELGMAVVNEEEFYDPDVNIRLGYYYLAKLSREFNGNMIFALAAYNAGLTNAKTWAKAYHGEPDQVVIRSIPFAETRGFIRGVLTRYQRYKWLQNFRQSIRGRKGTG